MQSFEPPLGHRRMVLGPEALPSQDKSSQPVLGLFPCVGLSFHCKLSVCSSVLLKHVCPVAPGNPTAVVRSPPIQSPYRLLCHQQAGAHDGCRHANGPEEAAERDRGHGDWHPLLKLVCVSSPCEESLFHPCLTVVCFPWLWYQHTVGRIVGTWAPGDRPQMSLARKTPYIFFTFRVDQVGFLSLATKSL